MISFGPNYHSRVSVLSLYIDTKIITKCRMKIV